MAEVHASTAHASVLELPFVMGWECCIPLPLCSIEIMEITTADLLQALEAEHETRRPFDALLIRGAGSPASLDLTVQHISALNL